MEHFNEESKRQDDSPALERGEDRITEPKPQRREDGFGKAKPLRREDEGERPADPLLGFVVRPEEMEWIRGLLEELTPRQQQVLLECCNGGTSPEIAVRMGMSQSTLQNHLHAMRHKLGVTGRDGMARLVGVRLLEEYRTR